MELLRRFMLGAGLFAAALVAAPVMVAAAGNALDTAAVSPGSGSVATNFTFSVHYSSRRGHPASAVTASAGGKTVALALVSGTATDGVYRGVGRLPVGSWNVVFKAKVIGSRSPMLVGPTVTVAALAPTPAPTPKPVVVTPVTKPVATPVPDSVVALAPPPPAPVAVAPVVVAPRVPVAAPVVTPVPKPAAAKPAVSKAPVKSHAPAAASLTAPGGDAQQLSNLMLGGLGGIGLVAAFWFLVAGRRRSEPVPEALPEVVAVRNVAPPAPPAPWEVDSRLEDEPIGTVDYLPLGAADAIGTLPPMEPRPHGTNPHAARIQAARNSRESYERERSRLLQR